MVTLFEQYSSFCRGYRINVNWSKCSVTVFCEQDAEGLAAEKARLKEATAQRTSAPRKQTKAKSLRLATEAREQSQSVYMTVQGQGMRGEGIFPHPWCPPPEGLWPSWGKSPCAEQGG
jgi:hypothetical protein